MGRARLTGFGRGPAGSRDGLARSKDGLTSGRG